MGKLKFPKGLEEAILRTQNIKKKNHGKGGVAIEVDYFKAQHWLKDDNGKLFHPLVIIFVHQKSHFLLGTHMALPSQGFLADFFNYFLEILETSPARLGKISVKKQDLFDLFEKIATDLGIEIEMAKRLPEAEFVKGDLTKFLNNKIGSKKTSQKKNAKKISYKKVYQFKILLDGSSPSIWRRIQVPESYSFWDLHVAIQDAMGWSDCHLHDFRTISKNPRETKCIGIPDFESDADDVLAGWEEKISKWFPAEKKMRYTYDFGDNWEHMVTLEKILPVENGMEYPVCVAGEMACPFEDSGAIWGYYDKLEILKNPKHPEYEEIVEWVGDELFDPTEFAAEEVFFSDPAKRLKELLESE